jgi:chromosome partitioning protein
LCHQKGGVGKSTLSIALALVLDADILDLDSQRSCILFQKIRKHKHPGRRLPNFYTIENAEELEGIFKPFTGRPDKILLIDSGGYDSDLTRVALINTVLSGGILITPLGASQIELFGLQKFKRILEEASGHIGKTVKTNVLINNADPRSKAAIIKLREFIAQNSKHFSLLDTVIHSRMDFKKAYAEGLSVIELNSKSKAAQEMQGLAGELNVMISKL